ncbi:MAG: hypothetical protein JWL76_2332 [Thermoleophilia bacterium]|nr:hypothetical protein [Thermoleophilia bacterium]
MTSIDHALDRHAHAATTTAKPAARDLAAWQWAAPLGAALACTAAATIQLTHPEYTDVDPLNDGTFLALLALTVVSFHAVRRMVGGSAWPAWLATVGISLLIVGVVVGLVQGTDPEWFFALAGPGLLSWLVASIALAIRAWRTRTLPRWCMPIFALQVSFVVMASNAGGALVAAIMWAAVAHRIARRA